MTRLGMLWVFAVLLVASGGSNNFAEEQVDIIKQIADSEDQASLEASLQAALDKLKMKKLENPRGQGHSAVTAVIGGGLSGLTAALALLEEGVPVALIDKSKFMGGNSAKASSGINGALTTQQSADKIDDSADRFFMDTLRSSTREEGSYTGMLARKMADDSKHAVDWIQSKANVELPDVGQMGGHSAARTHRPRGRLSGAAFVSGLERAVMKFSSEGLLTVHKRTALAGFQRTRPLADSSAKSLHTLRVSPPQMAPLLQGTVSRLHVDLGRRWLIWIWFRCTLLVFQTCQLALRKYQGWSDP